MKLRITAIGRTKIASILIFTNCEGTDYCINEEFGPQLKEMIILVLYYIIKDI